jgi:hypothetical protein
MRHPLLVAFPLALALTATSADARHHGRWHWGGWGYSGSEDRPARAERDAQASERDPLARQVPAGWRLQAPDPKWDGQRWVAPDGDAWLAIYSTPTEQDRDQHLKAVAFVDGEEITYLRREPDWLAVSGFKADRIFYRKVVLACGDRVWRHVAFEYPAAAKRAFDRLVERFSRALGRDERGGCDSAATTNAQSPRR